MFSKELHVLVEELDALCRQEKLKIALAESCTGGLVGTCITSYPGVSDWFYGSYVTYSNDAKKNMINVSSIQLVQHGAVSEEVAKAMVEGIFETAEVDYGISITGVAGPGGGTEEKPVGTVWFGFGSKEKAIDAEKQLFLGDRAEIRTKTAAHALKLLIAMIEHGR